MRSRLPSPSESNSASTQRVSRIHFRASANSSTTCASPSMNLGVSAARAEAARTRDAAAITAGTRLRADSAMRTRRLQIIGFLA